MDKPPNDSKNGVLLFRVLLFASLRDAGGESIEVRVAAQDATVQGLLEQCTAQHPQIARWLPHVRVAVNREYALPQHNLEIGDEIAFVPPVSGGAQIQA